MNNFLSLAKMYIKYNFFTFDFKTKKERNKFIALFISVAICLLVPLLILTYTCYSMSQMAAQAGVLADVLAVFFFMSQIVVLVYGTANFLNIVYFSKDNEFLLSLPIKQSSVFAVKFFVVYLSEMIVSAIFILPLTIITAVACANIGYAIPIYYYFLIIPAIFLIPAIPMFLISLISFPLMALISRIKKHPIVTFLLAVVAFLGVYLAIYIPILKFSSTSVPSEGGTVDYTQYFSTFSSISKYTVFAGLFSKAMLGIRPLLNLGIFLLATIGFTSLSAFISTLTYRKNLSDLIEGTGRSTKQKKTGVKEKTVSLKTPKRAILERELKSILRDPMMAFQNFMGCLLTPILLYVICKFSFSSTATESPEDIEMIKLVSMIMVNFFILMMSGVSPLAMTGFSREGANFALLKTFPISYKEILSAKLLICDILSTLTVFLSVIAAALLNIFNIIDLIGLFIADSIFSMSFSSFALVRDAKNPNLNWVNIKEITKNNMSSLVLLGLSTLVALITSAVLGLFYGFKLLSNTYLNSLIIWIIAIILSIGCFFLLRYNKSTKLQKYFEETEC